MTSLLPQSSLSMCNDVSSKIRSTDCSSRGRKLCKASKMTVSPPPSPLLPATSICAHCYACDVGTQAVYCLYMHQQALLLAQKAFTLIPLKTADDSAALRVVMDVASWYSRFACSYAYKDSHWCRCCKLLCLWERRDGGLRPWMSFCWSLCWLQWGGQIQAKRFKSWWAHVWFNPLWCCCYTLASSICSPVLVKTETQ